MNSLLEHKLPDDFFPNVVKISFGVIDECRGEMYDEELKSIRRAVSKRKKEFAAGRIVARSALAKLGVESGPIPVGLNREPLWPPGVIGSITHDNNFCIAVAALEEEIALIGIDLTTQDPLEKEVIDLICTAGEIEHARGVLSRMEIDPYKLIFSIKESVYKCLFPAIQEMFDFHSVSVTLDTDSASATIDLLDRRLFSDLKADLDIKVKFCSFDTFIFSVVWIETLA